jgi:hypothetical protein
MLQGFCFFPFSRSYQLTIKFQIQHNQQCRKALQMNLTILVVEIQQIAGMSQ